MALYESPGNAFVAEFLGTPKINLLPYTIDSDRQNLVLGSSARLPLSGLGFSALQAEHGVQLGVRPEAVSVEVQGEGLPAVVEFTERLGDSMNVYLRLPNAGPMMVAKLGQADRPLQVGQGVVLRFDSARLLVFGSDGRTVR